jgi:hypothetical protein
MWCVPQLDQEYLQRMEAVLAVLNRPLDKHAPVVALDERPVQLVNSPRPATAMAPGRPALLRLRVRALRHCQCVLRGRAQNRSPSDPRHEKS